MPHFGSLKQWQCDVPISQYLAKWEAAAESE